jgi:hypothetical protein
LLQELKALQGERLKVQSELRKLQLERAALDDKTEPGPKPASQPDARSQLDRRIDLLKKLADEIGKEYQDRVREAEQFVMHSTELDFRRMEINEAEAVLGKLRAQMERLEICRRSPLTSASAPGPRTMPCTS